MRTTFIKTLSLAAIGAFAVAAMPIASANAQTFTAGTASVGSIGADFASAFDILDINPGGPLSGSFAAGNPQTLAALVFTVGSNCNTCSLTPSSTLGFALTVGSDTQTAYLGWAWSSTGATDTLALTAPGTMTFVQPDGEVDTLTFTVDPSMLASGDLPVTSSLQASVGVPEPASMALLGFGLAGLVAARRRR